MSRIPIFALSLAVSMFNHASAADLPQASAPANRPAPSHQSELESVRKALMHSEELEKYRSAISDLAGNHGPSYPGLAEPLAVLSNLLIQDGQIDEALQLLERQLQLERINNGLYSEEQIPLIEKIMGLNAILRNWGEVNLGVEHLRWLHSRASEMSVAESLESKRRLRDWHMLLLNNDIREREALHLLGIREIAEQSLDLGRSQLAADNPALATLLYDRAQAELYIALAIALTSDTGSMLITKTEGIAQTAVSPQNNRYTTVQEIEMTYGPRTSTVIDRSFREAMQRHHSYLSEIHDLHESNGNKEAQGMALVYMADSVLMREQYESNTLQFARRHRGHGNIGSAAKIYNDAQNVLLDAGIEASVVERFFSCPALLPLDDFTPELPERPLCVPGEPLDLGDIHLLVESVPGPPQAAAVRAVAEDVTQLTYTQVNFKVRANGQPARIDVVSAAPDTIRNRARARDVVERLQFRPALEDGSPRTHEMVTMRLVLPED